MSRTILFNECLQSLNSLMKLMNLSSTLLYLTVIMHCITSCQLSKANDTNLGRKLTVSPWRATYFYDNCNVITRMLIRDACWLLWTRFYSFKTFNYTFALYCSLCCVTVPWNQYSDADYDVCVACCVLFCIMTLASFSVWWNTAQNYMHRTHICPVLWLLVCHAYLLCTLKKLIYHNE